MVSWLSLPQSNFFTDITLFTLYLFFTLSSDSFHSVLSFNLSFSMISKLLSFFEVIFFRLWNNLILLNFFHLLSCLKCCSSQILFFFKILLVLNTFLNLCLLLVLNFRLSLSHIQRVNYISKRFIYSIMLKWTTICGDSHMNWDGVTSWIFPIWNTWRDFKILHILFGKFSRGWPMHRWWRWTWSWWQFSVFMLSW